ncbi:hypothetical protein AVEN_235425-1 [Araneus ventricosus]|uniref:Uncharacterized protein n=1 Tax=Araneus ventricosus TaxID=182803 RepID=A0A4Y2A6D6_ARAVE|nr:hypothetical protein AVEN_235425-1 [Araneus ventricosus]
MTRMLPSKSYDCRVFCVTKCPGAITCPATVEKRQHEGYFGTDLVILCRGQMTRPTPELDKAPNFRIKQVGGHLAPTNLACTRPACTEVPRWNRDSNLESSGPEVKISPPGHRGL